MESIKLYEIEPLKPNIRRFQSQLRLGFGNSADFIIEDNVLKQWSYKPKFGVGFHPCDLNFIIVDKKSDMTTQLL